MFDNVPLSLTLVVLPVIGLVVLLFFINFFNALAQNLSARAVFCAKGYRVHQVVRLNGAPALITKIGVWSTHFLMYNGKEWHEFEAVSNVRLDYQDVQLVIPRLGLKTRETT